MSSARRFWACVVGRHLRQDAHQRKLFGSIESHWPLFEVFSAREKDTGERCGGNGAAGSGKEAECFGGVILESDVVTVEVDRDSHLRFERYPPRVAQQTVLRGISM